MSVAPTHSEHAIVRGQAVSPELSRALAGATVCYVSNADFSGWTRTYRQAMSAAAGARVVFVGWDYLVPRAISDSPFEVIAVEPADLPEPYSSCARSETLRELMDRTVYRSMNTTVYRAREARRIARDRRAFISAIESTGADIVQSIDLTPLADAAEATRSMGAKLVYDSHEYWAGFLQNPVWDNARAWTQGLLQGEGEIICDVDLVLAVSDPMGDRLADRYGICHPLTILNAPLDRVTRVRPVPMLVKMVFHGGLSSDRNIDGLIRAMGHFGGRATLDIHGFDRTVGVENLQALVDELNLGDTVRFHGAFEYLGVVEMLRGYDVGVMTAKVVEENFEVTLPNKVFDCMCAGVAIAMYDAPAIRALLSQVPFGITIDPASPDSIARDLELLVGDPERVTRMKVAAVEASPHFWWPEQGRRLIRALESLPVGKAKAQR